MTYYKAKVVSKIENEKNGKLQKTTEEYLVYAVSVTDVEVQIGQKYAGVGFDWELKSVVETKILEVLTSEKPQGVRV